MKVFLDTEFTNFINTDLISIGMVAENGLKFYAERSDYEKAWCSDFVKDVVLPQLGKHPNLVYQRPRLKQEVLHWLRQFQNPEPLEEQVIICYDYIGDWQLFTDLLDENVPEWIRGRNIYNNINNLALEIFWMESKLQDHHALHDAMANQFAFRERPEPPNPLKLVP